MIWRQSLAFFLLLLNYKRSRKFSLLKYIFFSFYSILILIFSLLVRGCHGIAYFILIVIINRYGRTCVCCFDMPTCLLLLFKWTLELTTRLSIFNAACGKIYLILIIMIFNVLVVQQYLAAIWVNLVGLKMIFQT